MIGCTFHATAPNIECSALLIWQSQGLFEAIMTRTRGLQKYEKTIKQLGTARRVPTGSLVTRGPREQHGEGRSGSGAGIGFVFAGTHEFPAVRGDRRTIEHKATTGRAMIASPRT